MLCVTQLLEGSDAVELELRLVVWPSLEAIHVWREAIVVRWEAVQWCTCGDSVCCVQKLALITERIPECEPC